MMRLRRLRLQHQGQGLVEYALIILLVAMVAILSLGAFGTALTGIFTSIAGML